MEFQLKIIGSLFVLLAGIHIPFPRYFNWRKELGALSLINRQMMQTHTFFIGLMVFLMGVLCLSYTKELVETRFGQRLLFGLGIFWLCRMYFQLFFYSRKLWKGRVFETIIHIVFSLFWIYVCTVFFYLALR